MVTDFSMGNFDDEFKIKCYQAVIYMSLTFKFENGHLKFLVTSDICAIFLFCFSQRVSSHGNLKTLNPAKSVSKMKNVCLTVNQQISHWCGLDAGVTGAYMDFWPSSNFEPLNDWWERGSRLHQGLVDFEKKR